jgi:hypothetical protein
MNSKRGPNYTGSGRLSFIVSKCAISQRCHEALRFYGGTASDWNFESARPPIFDRKP